MEPSFAQQQQVTGSERKELIPLCCAYKYDDGGKVNGIQWIVQSTSREAIGQLSEWE